MAMLNEMAKTKFWLWLADRMPKTLVYYCAVRIAAHAAGPAHPEQVVPELTMLEALERWRTDCAAARRMKRGPK